MIERQLQLGIRLKWNRPRSTMANPTGDIVRSATPANPMLYDGLDGTLVNKHFQKHDINVAGFTMRMPIAHDWLEYRAGFTTFMPLAQDVLTGPMSGCLIAVWNGTGGRTVGHVGTVDNRGELNLTLKGKFKAAALSNLTAFNPASVWDQQTPIDLANQVKAQSSTIIALVTSTGAFYSLVILENVGGVMGDCCVGGIKRVQPMTPPQLQQYLTTTIA